MKTYAKFIFEKIPEAGTRFILREHSGADISNFPAVWKLKTHRYYGERYIVFKRTDPTILGQRFTHCFCIGDRRIAFFSFKPQFPNKSWTVYGDDAILIDFNNDRTVLSLMFFKGMKDHAYSLFKQWTAGKLEQMKEKIEAHDLPTQLEFNWDD